MSADTIRQQFIDFFMSKGHTHIPSSSVVPENDPTLLFANAGMNQFKPIFLGQEHKFGDIKRACNSQKCIRAGGKHNDLDDVGKDGYHHTFFEMLGNWSFGDYWKEEAIDYAWELLVDVYKLDPKRLYVTYFGGDKVFGLEPDLETKELWKKYVPASRILPGSRSDNFWEMGDRGPCGPCTEIHYDRVGNRDASGLVNKDDPQVLELWNLVFTQYNRIGETELVELESRFVDTGMGFERLVSVLEDKGSNYDTDVFREYFNVLENELKLPKYAGDYTGSSKVDFGYRVLADHIRTIILALGDGATIGFEGRGHVLKRMMRRALSVTMQISKKPLDTIVKVAEQFCSLMVYFGIDDKATGKVREVLTDEVRIFIKSEKNGINKTHNLIARYRKMGSNLVPGSELAFLYTSTGIKWEDAKELVVASGMITDEYSRDHFMKIHNKMSKMRTDGDK